MGQDPRRAHGLVPTLGPLMHTAKAEVLSFTAFPREHWRTIRSSTPRRPNVEIKRRSRIVGIFPDAATVIRLIGAVLIDLHDEWIPGDRRYLSEGSTGCRGPPWSP